MAADGVGATEWLEMGGEKGKEGKGWERLRDRNGKEGTGRERKGKGGKGRKREGKGIGADGCGRQMGAEGNGCEMGGEQGVAGNDERGTEKGWERKGKEAEK